MSVFTSDIANALKLTLEKIITDPSHEKNVVYKTWIKVMSQEDAWVDDQEVAGPGLAAMIGEGEEIPMGDIKQGYRTRYTAEKFGLQIVVTEEAMDDNKYSEVINAAGRLSRSLYKTLEIDTTNILVRGFNTSYPGGDGQPLWSASHTLAGGGTFSNVFATPMSPSRTAVIIGRAQARKFVGHDGVVEGVRLKKVVFPVEQWGVWEGLVGSEKAPENDTNEINVVRGLGLELCENPYWDNTTTNWAFLTDCDDQINMKWRKKPTAKNWVENSQQVMHHSNTARWSTGWSNPRCTLGSEA